jgi:ubiquinone/menaquinone biosynthesis C-methylase UbiE
MPSRDYHEGLWEGVPEGLEPSDFELRRRFLLAHLGPDSQVLDVGCGEGRFSAEIARVAASVVGIDVAEEPLRRARALHPGLDLRLVNGDGPWPLPDNSFDVVWAGEVIEHVADTAGWLSEIRRVLRSGGALLLTTPANEPLTLLRLALSRRAFERHFDPRGDHLRFYTRGALSALLADFGFQEIQVSPAGGAPGARRVLLARAVRSRYQPPTGA